MFRALQFLLLLLWLLHSFLFWSRFCEHMPHLYLKTSAGPSWVSFQALVLWGLMSPSGCAQSLKRACWHREKVAELQGKMQLLFIWWALCGPKELRSSLPYHSALICVWGGNTIWGPGATQARTSGVFRSLGADTDALCFPHSSFNLSSQGEKCRVYHCRRIICSVRCVETCELIINFTFNSVLICHFREKNI